MRSVIDALIASCRLDEAIVAALPAEQRALVVSLREEFLLAGAAHIEQRWNPQRWLQVGIRCRSGAASDRWLGGALRNMLTHWKHAGACTRAFFMRKPPGLRLRFGGSDLDKTLGGELYPWLDHEVASGRIAGYERGVYDAETYQFGGITGLDIAHDFHAADSSTLVDLLAESVDPATLPTLSLALLNDLFERICGDAWEMWDTWRNLELAGRIPRITDPVAARALLDEQRDTLLATLQDRGAILDAVEPRVAVILQRAFDSNAGIAARIASAARAGTLLYGPRQILPFYAIFHWNRCNFSSARQMTLAYFMQTLLDPKEPDHVHGG